MHVVTHFSCDVQHFVLKQGPSLPRDCRRDRTACKKIIKEYESFYNYDEIIVIINDLKTKRIDFKLHMNYPKEELGYTINTYSSTDTDEVNCPMCLESPEYSLTVLSEL